MYSRTLDLQINHLTYRLLCAKIKVKFYFGFAKADRRIIYVFDKTAYSTDNRTQGEKQQGYPADGVPSGGKIDFVPAPVLKC